MEQSPLLWRSCHSGWEAPKSGQFWDIKTSSAPLPTLPSPLFYPFSPGSNNPPQKNPKVWPLLCGTGSTSFSTLPSALAKPGFFSINISCFPKHRFSPKKRTLGGQNLRGQRQHRAGDLGKKAETAVRSGKSFGKRRKKHFLGIWGILSAFPGSTRTARRLFRGVYPTLNSHFLSAARVWG